MRSSKVLAPMLALLLAGGSAFAQEQTPSADRQPSAPAANAGTRWSRWQGEVGVGYTQSQGAISDVFRLGVEMSLGVGRLLGSRVYLESGFSFGATPLSNARVIGEACVGLVCDDMKEAGYFISLPFGLSVPIRLGSGGRSLQIGGGLLYRMYGVANVGDYGSRDGVGLYGKLALDLTHSLGESLPVVLGLVLKVSRTSTSGESFEGRITSSKTGDTWFTIGVAAYNR